ncbi:hypothetical protein [Nocardioides sp.]|uniref:hypothetical protein n=1 Tax=Nocardioides sp. TaxID=35761 RepID=UPI0035158115
MPESPGPESPEPGPETAWERRRRLAEVFGDTLPETTSDERDPAPTGGTGTGESATDRWLKEQVPPHHG